MRTIAQPHPTANRELELQELRRDVRSMVAEWLAAGRFQPRCDAWMRSYDRDFSKAMAERGWIGITWPADYGGAGRSNLARLVVTEEMLRVGAPVTAHWIADRQIGPAILRYGTEDLKAEFLPRIAAGELTFCLGMSEPEAGSDLAAVSTAAVQVDGGWRITGTKVWTGQAHRADYAYVLARTDSTCPKHEGLTEFIVDMTSPGVSTEPLYHLNGEHVFNRFILDEVFVPDQRVIGTVGNGWKQVTAQLAYERGGVERFLSTYPLVQVMVAESSRGDEMAVVAAGRLVARLVALRRLAWRVAAASDRGEPPVVEAATLKILGTEFEGHVANVARSVFGVEPDPTSDAALPRLLAQAVVASPGFTIRGGSTEVLLGIVAKAETRA